MSTTQLVLVSSAESLLSAAAAVDAGLLDRPRRRALVVFGRAPVPETALLPHEQPGMSAASARFDDVIVFDELVQPSDPGRWSPRADDRPVLARLLRQIWGIGDDSVTIVVDRPLTEQPVEWLLSAFYGCEVIRLMTGVAGYGPASQEPGWALARRTSRRLYRAVVPGLSPWPERDEDRSGQGMATVAIPAAALGALIDEVAVAAGVETSEPGAGRTALVLAESFVAAGLLTRDQETALWREALEAAVAADVSDVVVLADPIVPANLGIRLGHTAAEGVRVALVEHPAPAEVYLARMRPAVVVGTMSAALLQAWTDGARVVTVGTKQIKEQLRPYSHPARLPWVVVDAVLREDDRWAAAADLEGLIHAVAFCMYPERFAGDRAEVMAFLEALEPHEVGRYTTMNRAQKLGLLPVPEPSPELEPARAEPVAPPRAEGWFRGLVRQLR